MNSNAYPTLSSAAASPHAPASPSPELSAARLARDGLAALLRTERTAAADFLLALADFDRCRGWERLGHASLFAFLVTELKLSKGAAYVRFRAARLLQDFPEVIEPIRAGQFCLSAAGELARVATAENFAEVLPRFFGCSSREAREVAAAILPRPAPPTRDQVTRLALAFRRQSPLHAPSEEPHLALSPAAVAVALDLEPLVDSESVRAHEPDLTHPAQAAVPRDHIEPLTADLRRLHVTVTRQLLAKLDAARDGLSHALPGATTEQVIEAALDLLLEKQARSRAQVKKPRTAVAPFSPQAPRSAEPVHRRSEPRETIPAAVRRAVWDRDGGRCAWPLDSGGTCGSTHRLELDHVVPWARFGDSVPANLRVVCAAHNRVAARLAFGAPCVDRYAGSPRLAAASPRVPTSIHRAP